VKRHQVLGRCVVEVGDAQRAEGVVVNYLREFIRRAPRPGDVGKILVFVPNRNAAMEGAPTHGIRPGVRGLLVNRHLGGTSPWKGVEERFRREEKVFLDLKFCFDLYWTRSCFSWDFLMRWASVRARCSWAT